MNWLRPIHFTDEIDLCISRICRITIHLQGAIYINFSLNCTTWRTGNSARVHVCFIYFNRYKIIEICQNFRRLPYKITNFRQTITIVIDLYVSSTFVFNPNSTLINKVAIMISISIKAFLISISNTRLIIKVKILNYTSCVYTCYSTKIQRIWNYVLSIFYRWFFDLNTNICYTAIIYRSQQANICIFIQI